MTSVCLCSEGAACWYSPDGIDGYPYCRSCDDHHRPPECPVNERGESLAPCGCTWAETDAPGYYDKPCRHRQGEDDTPDRRVACVSYPQPLA